MEHQLERRRVAGGGTALDAPRYLKLCVINELQILNDMLCEFATMNCL